jgi:diaminopropionate ammonia-lyase
LRGENLVAPATSDEVGGKLSELFEREGPPGLATEEPSRFPLEFHRRLPGYEVTPVISPELAGLGALLVKDESHRLGLPSFKILGASWAVLQALEQHVGALGSWEDVADLAERLGPHKPLALAAATDGNHGRAVARMAKLLGLEARIYVPEGTATARIDAIASEGAACEVVAGGYDDAVAHSATQASESCLVISDTSWPGYERVPRWVIEGYSTIFWELEEQLERAPDVVVIQMGVGALAAAAVAHFRRRSLDSRPYLVGVEPLEAACVLHSMRAGEITTLPGEQHSIMAGLNCGTPSRVAWPLISQGIDCYLAVSDERAQEAMRVLADAGVISGETGAAGLAGVLELVARGHEPLEEAVVLVLSTEGATDPASYERIVGAAAASE